MIHQYKNNGYAIIMDINSGAVHAADDTVYDAVACLSGKLPDMEKPEPIPTDLKEEVRTRLCGAYKSQDIEDALSDIQELIDREELFTKDVYKDYVIDFKNRKTVVKALCLHIAHDCNLACKYCFAEEGEYHGRRALMSFEVGKKALDFLIANSGSRRNLEVDFFGGEPLMNWQVVKQLVEYGGFFIEADLPSPLMGYPGALGLDLTQEAGDFEKILAKVESTLVEKGAADRFGTWAYSYGYTLSAGLAEHAKNVIDGKCDITDMDAVAEALNVYSPKAEWNGAGYTNATTGVKSDNVFLIYQDTYIMGNPGRFMGNADVEIPDKYYTVS